MRPPRTDMGQAEAVSSAAGQIQGRSSEPSAGSEAERADRRFRDLVENLNAIVWEADPRTGQFTFVSRRAEKMLGYPIREWLQDPDFWNKLVHPDDREAAAAGRRRALEQGRSGALEYRV